MIPSRKELSRQLLLCLQHLFPPAALRMHWSTTAYATPFCSFLIYSAWVCSSSNSIRCRGTDGDQTPWCDGVADFTGDLSRVIFRPDLHTQAKVE
jgi:hypothetical protein